MELISTFLHANFPSGTLFTSFRLILILLLDFLKYSDGLSYSLIPPQGILSVYSQKASSFDSAFPEFITHHQPATFNPRIQKYGHVIQGRLIATSDTGSGCDKVPPIPHHHHRSNTQTDWILLVDNLGCDAKIKIHNAAKAGYSTLLIGNTNSQYDTQIINIDADSTTGIDKLIYTSSISAMDAYVLSSLYAYPTLFYIQIEESPFLFVEILYHLMLICFVITGLFIGLFCATWLYDVFKCESCIQEIESDRRQSVLRVLLKKKTMTRAWTADGPFLNNDACIICLEEFSVNDQIRVLPCLHVFHVDCVDVWVLKMCLTCPICKQTIIGSIVEERAALRDLEAQEERRNESHQLLNSAHGANSAYNSFSVENGRFLPMDLNQSLHFSFYSILNDESEEEGTEELRPQQRLTRNDISAANANNSTLGSYNGPSQSDNIQLSPIHVSPLENSQSSSSVEYTASGTSAPGDEWRNEVDEDYNNLQSNSEPVNSTTTSMLVSNNLEEVPCP